jgi:hypothetical protein
LWSLKWRNVFSFFTSNVSSFRRILLQFIVFAELLFTSLLNLSDCWTVSWWLFRISMFQQNILDELSSSLYDQVQVYKNKMLGHFGELEKVSTYWNPLLCDGEGSYFVSAAFLEAGIAEYKYGRVDASRSLPLPPALSLSLCFFLIRKQCLDTVL